MKNKSLASNTLFYMLYNVLNIVFPFITGIYVSRVLLPTAIGEVEAARNLAQYFVILSFLGIPTYGLREIAKHKDNTDEKNKIFSELFIINSISTLFFLVLYIAVIATIPIYREKFLLYCITGISIALNFFNISWIYEGLEKFSFISLRNIIFKLVSFILLILFVKNESDTYIYAIITVVGTAGNYLVNMVALPKYTKFTFKGLKIQRHIKSIFYLVAVNLAIEIYSLVDVTMINILCSSEKVAFYSYGNKIFGILKAIINAITVVLVPRMASLYHDKQYKDFSDLLSTGVKSIFFLAIPIIAGVLFVSNNLVVLIYGESFASSATVLNVLVFLLMISPTGYILGSRVMLVTNNEKLMIIPVVVGAIINVLANLLFINLFQEIGAAIASLISETVVMTIYVFLSHKYYKLNGVLRDTLKILISTILMIGVLFVISVLNFNTLITSILQIGFGILTYALSIVLSKEDVATKVLNGIKARVIKR